MGDDYGDDDGLMIPSSSILFIWELTSCLCTSGNRYDFVLMGMEEEVDIS